MFTALWTKFLYMEEEEFELRSTRFDNERRYDRVIESAKENHSTEESLGFEDRIEVDKKSGLPGLELVQAKLRGCFEMTH